MRSIYITIAYIALNAFMLAAPGEYVGFDSTPLYTLAVLLGTGAVFPFLWRFFTGSLRDAFAELDARTITQLCVVPLLFFVLDQCYSSIRSTLDYDSIQTAAIFLLILVTGLATYYISLRMVLDNARHTRLAVDMKMKEQSLAADNAALDRLNRMKTELIATISHETMTPLAVLSGYAELVAMELREKGVDKQTAKDLDNIAEETQRISRLMDELQNHTRKHDDRLFKTRLDLSTLIGGVARLYTPILTRRHTELAARLPGGLPDVYACAGEVTQVVFNLLQNARNHTENGTVTITAEAEDDTVAVTVSDTGCGIPPELLPRVFERGVSGGEGGGLGLYICKEIIASHNGTIDITSEPGKGTSLRFTLPVWKGMMGNDAGQKNDIIS
jgi:signal transduction histidine kinase